MNHIACGLTAIIMLICGITIGSFFATISVCGELGGTYHLISTNPELDGCVLTGDHNDQSK